MAKVGMEYVVSAKLTEGDNGSATYSQGKYWGPASSFNLAPNANNVTDYGDDRAVETDTTVNNIGVTVELNENTLELESFLLGHEYSSSDKTMTASRDDVAPFVGIGCVGKSMKNNSIVYRAIWVCKVQMRDPSDDNSTKQESTSFNHSTYEGTAYALKDTNGTMTIKAEFDTLADAKSFLNTKAGITTATSGT